jgi:hypothetical protein
MYERPEANSPKISSKKTNLRLTCHFFLRHTGWKEGEILACQNPILYNRWFSSASIYSDYPYPSAALRSVANGDAG